MRTSETRDTYNLYVLPRYKLVTHISYVTINLVRPSTHDLVVVVVVVVIVIVICIFYLLVGLI